MFWESKNKNVEKDSKKGIYHKGSSICENYWKFTVVKDHHQSPSNYFFGVLRSYSTAGRVSE